MFLKGGRYYWRQKTKVSFPSDVGTLLRTVRLRYARSAGGSKLRGAKSLTLGEARNLGSIRFDTSLNGWESPAWAGVSAHRPPA
jgi:hypothetical protein